MQIKTGIISFLILLQFGLPAQNFSDKQIKQRDSLTAKLKADSSRIFKFQKLRPYFNLDQRHSFIRNAPISVNGFQIGIILHERHVLGLGTYSVAATTNQKAKTKSDKNIDVVRTLDMKYETVFYVADIVVMGFHFIFS